MIKVESAAESRGLLITDQILFGIGYAGLLYSSYTLVLDLYVFFSHIFYDQDAYRSIKMSRAEQESNRSGKEGNNVLHLLRNRHLFRMTMIVAVVLGIVASTTLSKTGTSGSTATSLREASTIIFLALTGLLTFQTLRLAHIKQSGGSCL